MDNTFSILHIRAINAYIKKGRTITVGQTEHGNWLIADDDMEVAALVVVRYMLRKNIKFVWGIRLLSIGNNHTLYMGADRETDDPK
jgi:hypothetical protein